MLDRLIALKSVSFFYIFAVTDSACLFNQLKNNKKYELA